ncbi:TPA: PhzF family phenazine biosynthesis isomerase, partial [Listeria innocua]
MNISVYVASAFSKNNNGGNKAGVVLNEPTLTTQQKMAIAKQLGYAETAFVTDSKIADYKLEYFTPKEEVDLCGHATIG